MPALDRENSSIRLKIFLAEEIRAMREGVPKTGQPHEALDGELWKAGLEGC
jgi:hypothetical protein